MCSEDERHLYWAPCPYYALTYRELITMHYSSHYKHILEVRWVMGEIQSGIKLWQRQVSIRNSSLVLFGCEQIKRRPATNKEELKRPDNAAYVLRCLLSSVVRAVLDSQTLVSVPAKGINTYCERFCQLYSVSGFGFCGRQCGSVSVRRNIRGPNPHR